MNAFVFGDGWAAYRGQSSDNSPHRHAAIQLVFGSDRTVCVVGEDGKEFAGRTVVIQPMVEHSLIARDIVSVLYLEPQTPLAFRVMDEISAGDINIVNDPGFLGFDCKLPLKDWVEKLSDSAPRSGSTVDHRLSIALQQLAENPNEMQIAHMAEKLGLSDSRLRFLARDQLGFPLSTWMLWRKLDRAARALHDGETLVGAALLGGFSDQAHLSRTMRRMFGMTPRAVQGLTLASGGS
ncbi:helix-turn-helix domain-containing protein [Sphingopyxis sp.]|jgi:AraC-like DNA-binding protein|uniref:helix-turn-helix domain-containing protein n=1 Tax=Sphingopyxis sp. TaxID=1908224 RepID=UPI003F720EA4